MCFMFVSLQRQKRLISWQIDLVRVKRVDLVAIDLVRSDLLTASPRSKTLGRGIEGNHQRVYTQFRDDIH